MKLIAEFDDQLKNDNDQLLVKRKMTAEFQKHDKITTGRHSSDEQEQSELFRPYLSRLSDPLVRSPKDKHNLDNASNLNDKDRLNPYARETRESRATMLRKTEGRYQSSIIANQLTHHF